ncbi:MAG: carboxypeptidase-like regulatory domain-containing protein [Opitutaceae bacterium]|nr:carboxypeptidase-like regulatory domain-containing protein [Cytophagales bacterium]
MLGSGNSYFCGLLEKRIRIMFSKLKCFGLLLILWSTLAFSQERGKIAGKIEDSGTAEELIGVAVGIKGTSAGTSSDIEGNYVLLADSGVYTLLVSYVGYKTKEITGVIVVPGQVTSLNLTMEESILETEEVVITAEFKKESVNALMLERKNAVSVSDGISADLIRKTPDRNTSDILKRISGASIQDNKFAIIRGLNERYNSAFINNAPLPSSEPDRKAFAFDIFPANMVESMNIYKTATPDLPADFAGGVIKIKTKDIPDENFANLSFGIRQNTISTFKEGQTYDGGKTDWLGLDDGSRKLPSDFPSKEELTSDISALNLGDNAKDEIQAQAARNSRDGAQKFKNNWDIYKVPKLNPGTNAQFIVGRRIRNKLGIIVSASYLRNLRNIEGRYREYNDSKEIELDFKDRITNDEVMWGGIANISYKISENHKVSFKNTYNVNSLDQSIIREGQDYISSNNKFRIYNTNFVQNRFNSHQVAGEHFIPSGKFKLEWVGGFSEVYRQVPDYKILSYAKASNAGDDVKYTASIQGDPKTAGRFFSSMKEDIKSFSIDISKPLPTFGPVKTEIKVGTFIQERSRKFVARQFAYDRFKAGSAFDKKYKGNDSILALSPDKIFDNSNMDFEYNSSKNLPEGFTKVQDPNDPLGEKYVLYNASTGEYKDIPEKWIGTYTIDEVTDKQNQYIAGSSLRALYFMFDNKITKYCRLTWGLRYESFNQRLNTEFPQESRIIALNTLKEDFLPSVNFTINPIQKLNFRLAYYETVNRPEYRELAPFAFYDIAINRTVIGNDSLKRASIRNYDARAEFFPGAGQVISVTYFYKDFTNPIERYQRPDAGGIFIEFDNASKGYVNGIEFDIRQNLQFLSNSTKFLSRITLFGNLSLIKSSVIPNPKKAQFTGGSRPLQGQSDYLINAGVNYEDEEHGISLALMTNRVGRRIAYVGNSDEPHIWENPRTILDFQIAKSFYKKHCEAKINIGDILAQRLYFYQDLDGNKKFNDDKDGVIFDYLYGTNITYSLSYKF